MCEKKIKFAQCLSLMNSQLKRTPKRKFQLPLPKYPPVYHQYWLPCELWQYIRNILSLLLAIETWKTTGVYIIDVFEDYQPYITMIYYDKIKPSITLEQYKFLIYPSIQHTTVKYPNVTALHPMITEDDRIFYKRHVIKK